MPRPRKPIADLVEELRSWLPNFDHGPLDYPTLLWRILASLPGGDEAEDVGYEPFALGWHEADQLGRVLVAIEDKRDVEDLVRGLLSDEEEGGGGEVEERRRPPGRAARPGRHRVRAAPGGVEIGDVLQEWEPDEGEPDDLSAYVQVAATVGGRPVKLGTMVGVPEHLRGTARAAGGDTVGPYLSTWWADRSDWQDVSRGELAEVESALERAAPRLWREVQRMRAESRKAASRVGRR